MRTIGNAEVRLATAADGNLWLQVEPPTGPYVQVKMTDAEATQLRDSLTALLRRRRARRASRRRSSGSL